MSNATFTFVTFHNLSKWHSDFIKSTFLLLFLNIYMSVCLLLLAGLAFSHLISCCTWNHNKQLIQSNENVKERWKADQQLSFR